MFIKYKKIMNIFILVGYRISQYTIQYNRGYISNMKHIRDRMLKSYDYINIIEYNI